MFRHKRHSAKLFAGRAIVGLHGFQCSFSAGVDHHYRALQFDSISPSWKQYWKRIIIVSEV